MNIAAIFHSSEPNYCFAVDDKTLMIRLRTGKDDIKTADIMYANKYDWTEGQTVQSLVKTFSDNLYDFFEITLTLSDTRFAYIFYVCDNAGRFHYYSEDGVKNEYDFEFGFYTFFQVPFINKADIYSSVSWLDGAVFYQIFVDRYNIGNNTKDMDYVNIKWGDSPKPKSFAGGDIDGITEKLSYLVRLNINVIYLTPIFKSDSNHKYDIIDFYNVDETFGGDKALKNFVSSCKRHGIRVILDAVFNHCSNKNELFVDVVTKGKQSKYFDWFLIDGDVVNTVTPNYALFASCNYMPRFNTSNPELRKYLIDIGKYYIEKFDIDGWRLDVSDEVSHEFWREFRREIKSYEDKIIIGENWHNAALWLRGDEFDGVMNYGFTKASLDYFAFGKFDAEAYKNRLSEILMRYAAPINKSMLNLLDCHDTERFYTSTGSRALLLAAFSVMFCYEGMPCVYYGAEIGMKGGGDPGCRGCFDWNEKNWDKEIFGVVCKLIELRRGKKIGTGTLSLKAEDDVFILERKSSNATVTLYVNYSGIDKPINVVGVNLMTDKHIKCSTIKNEEFLLIEVKDE